MNICLVIAGYLVITVLNNVIAHCGLSSQCAGPNCTHQLMFLTVKLSVNHIVSTLSFTHIIMKIKATDTFYIFKVFKCLSLKRFRWFYRVKFQNQDFNWYETSMFTSCFFYIYVKATTRNCFSKEDDGELCFSTVSPDSNEQLVFSACENIQSSALRHKKHF